jgi:hypothetical protein
LQQRAFGQPADVKTIGTNTPNIMSNYLQVCDKRYFPLVQWEIIEKSYPKYPSASDLRITAADREQWVDLRPYANSAAVSVQETSSVEVSIPCLDRQSLLFFWALLTHSPFLVLSIHREHMHCLEVWVFAFFLS